MLFKMASEMAALGTVQNFLLGGGGYFSGKMPVKNAYSPLSLHKILETHHKASVKNGYPPPRVPETFQGTRGKSRERATSATGGIGQKGALCHVLFIFVCVKKG